MFPIATVVKGRIPTVAVVKGQIPTVTVVKSLFPTVAAGKMVMTHNESGAKFSRTLIVGGSSSETCRAPIPHEDGGVI
jgi:hypothetical protein